MQGVTSNLCRLPQGSAEKLTWPKCGRVLRLKHWLVYVDFGILNLNVNWLWKSEPFFFLSNIFFFSLSHKDIEFILCEDAVVNLFSLFVRSAIFCRKNKERTANYVKKKETFLGLHVWVKLLAANSFKAGDGNTASSSQLVRLRNMFRTSPGAKVIGACRVCRALGRGSLAERVCMNCAGVLVVDKGFG